MIAFRTIEEKDQPFVEKVYRSTREKELSSTNWPEEQKHRFVIMQSMAQELEYKNKFKDSTYQLILYKKIPAGRLYLWESDKELRVLDISLLPEFQGKGIGGKILTDIINSAHKKNKIVCLHVAPGNPAKKLYERLGFKFIRNEATREYMECKPA
jgi:ribosomal protein S18 acetylase RimI-like enzyme